MRYIHKWNTMLLQWRHTLSCRIDEWHCLVKTLPEGWHTHSDFAGCGRGVVKGCEEERGMVAPFADELMAISKNNPRVAYTYILICTPQSCSERVMYARIGHKSRRPTDRPSSPIFQISAVFTGYAPTTSRHANAWRLPVHGGRRSLDSEGHGGGGNRGRKKAVRYK